MINKRQKAGMMLFTASFVLMLTFNYAFRMLFPVLRVAAGKRV